MSLKGKALKNQKRNEDLRAFYGEDPYIIRYLVETDTKGMTCHTWRNGDTVFVSPYHANGDWTEDKIGFASEKQANAFIEACGFYNLSDSGDERKLMRLARC